MEGDVQQVFREVADLPEDERRRYFVEHHVPDAVRAAVESLLRFDSTSGALSAPIAGVAQSFLNRDSIGVCCGAYRLVRLLGQGGMGSVYLGERIDGEVEQQVAVKLVSSIAAESAFRERFLRERQILATLSHPGISRLLDAGHTAAGQPYLVMEYIDGTPIDVYAQDLPLREKIALLLPVADAVSYAHRNLVIHRDLKPSNILVDTAGRTKLLDFGIARILDEPDKPALTALRLLTLEYASPEQVLGKAQTTATDVYSLGAVLYRLLTGRSPHWVPENHPQPVEAVICSLEPAPPRRLDPTLPKDLDFIAGKALRKKPDERYESVDAFAEDLRAFLDSRPVRARSGSTWYRTRKFLARHWLGVAAAGTAVLCLAAGLLVANWERGIAERRFSQVRQTANKLLLLDGELRDLPGAIGVREKIVAASAEYLEGLSREVHKDRNLSMDLANGYWQLAHVEGVPPYPHLGHAAEADGSLRKADALVESVLAAAPGQPDALLLAGQIAQDRMILADSAGNHSEALSQASRASERLDKLVAGGKASKDQLEDAAYAYVNIGQANMNGLRYADAIRYVRRALEVGKTAGAKPQFLAGADSLLANALRYSGDLAAALESITEARRIAEHITFASETGKAMLLYAILMRQGSILGEDGSVSLERPADTVEPWQKAFDMSEKLAAADPHDAVTRDRIGTVGRLLAAILQHPDPVRALAICDASLRRIREIHDNIPARRDEARLLALSSYALRSLHRPEEAGARIDAALELLRATKDYPAAAVTPGGETEMVLRAQADQKADTGHPDRALADYRELLEKVMASHPSPESDLRQAADLSRIYEAAAALNRQQGNSGQAKNLEDQRRALWQGWDRKLPHNEFVQRRIAALQSAR